MSEPQTNVPSNPSFSYGDLIRDAFRISWRFKFLWFFGFFVAGGGGFSSSFNNVPTDFGGGDFGGGRIPSFVQDNALALIIVVALVALLLFLVFLVVGIISSGGLANSVAAIDGGEASGEERRFGSTWRAGTSVFWRVVLQGILLALISIALTVVILLVSGLPILLVFVLSQSVTARVLITALFALLGVVLFIVVFIPFVIIGQLALRELAVAREGSAQSIASAFRLFRRNLGRSLVVWLLNVALKIGVGIATLIVYLILGVILVGPGVALYLSDYTTLGVVLGVIGGVILLIPYVVLTGAVATFFHSYWTLAYLRLGRPSATPEPTPPPEPTPQS